MIALPFVITKFADIQANFEALAKEFPLSRRHIKLESAHAVGSGAPEPAFANSWVNYNTATHHGARFWKDAVGLVHIEGLVKDGTIGNPIFVLPAGYRPALGLVYPTDTNTGHGRVDIAPTGEVLPVSGGNTYFSISIPPFKQEQ
jgi:hypothetical protein